MSRVGCWPTSLDRGSDEGGDRGVHNLKSSSVLCANLYFLHKYEPRLFATFLADRVDNGIVDIGPTGAQASSLYRVPRPDAERHGAPPAAHGCGVRRAVLGRDRGRAGRGGRRQSLA